jgi:superfamily II DNA helicase RecQ
VRSFIRLTKQHQEHHLRCRTEYRELGRLLLAAVGKKPVLALTATAADSTVHALTNALRMTNPTIIRGPLFRSNLQLSVQARASNSMQLAQLLCFLQASDRLAVVFCNRKKTCEDLCARLAEKQPDWKITSFHGGLCSAARDSILQQCRENATDVLFCTTAFGLGINVNVRTVIHWDVPHSICQYVQEIGRAGRDGMSSMCRMFFSSDWYQKRCREARKNVGYVDVSVEQANEMQAYICCDDQCRHEFILRYFRAPDAQRCNGSCDNCAGRYDAGSM